MGEMLRRAHLGLRGGKVTGHMGWTEMGGKAMRGKEAGA